jgi:hypothetical protein
MQAFRVGPTPCSKSLIAELPGCADVDLSVNIVEIRSGM